MVPGGTKYVIINADDFGFSPGVTEGILRAHGQGVLTSTTVMANMPYAAEAVQRLAAVPDLGVGVHLNASQGPALSAAGRALAGPDGIMNRTATGVIAACIRHPSLLQAVEAEFDAQIRWVLDHGIVPTHLDSHRHSHAFCPIFARVVRLARRYSIPFVRWHGEHLPRGGRPWPAAPAKQRRIARILNVLGWANTFIAPQLRGTLGTWGIAHTGAIDAAFLVRCAQAAPPGVTEIMTHPGLADSQDTAATRLKECRQLELHALCDAAVREEFKNQKVELIHYGKLRDIVR